MASVDGLKEGRRRKAQKLNMDMESSSHPSIKGDLIGAQNSC